MIQRLHLYLPILLSLATIGAFLGQYAWPFELASHWHIQYFWLLILSSIPAWFKKQWKWVRFFSLMILLNASQFIQLQPARATTSDPQSELTIVQFNIRLKNEHPEKVRDYIDTQKPDILVLAEFNSHWHSQLKSTLDKFPYHKKHLREDPFGIGLYSRIPLKEAQIFRYGIAKLPSVHAKIKLKDENISILGIHPKAPSDPLAYQFRNTFLAELAENRESLEEKLIVIGDLNMSPWSYYFNQFLDDMRLIDTRMGFGNQASWPTMVPFFKLPLDHVLVSEGMQTVERVLGPDIGSDHFPVWVKLKI